SSSPSSARPSPNPKWTTTCSSSRPNSGRQKITPSTRRFCQRRHPEPQPLSCWFAQLAAAWHTLARLPLRKHGHRKDRIMQKYGVVCWTLTVLALAGLLPSGASAACCYFSAKDKDILQPAQKVFITWDAVEKVESFTVQPKFEGNALDFGMVIP